MAKTLRDQDLIEIVSKAPREIDDADTYLRFIEDLAELVTDYFGGDVLKVRYIDGHRGESVVSIGLNDSVPDDGGIFKDYDPEILWEEGEERLSPVMEKVKANFEEIARAEREAGSTVEIHEALPYVSIKLGESGAEYFFQDEEASRLLDEVPDWINDEDWILAMAQGWG